MGIRQVALAAVGCHGLARAVRNGSCGRESAKRSVRESVSERHDDPRGRTGTVGPVCRTGRDDCGGKSSGAAAGLATRVPPGSPARQAGPTGGVSHCMDSAPKGA
jgi:hypothetical protein